jgi:hypothetical protein
VSVAVLQAGEDGVAAFVETMLTASAITSPLLISKKGT